MTLMVGFLQQQLFMIMSLTVHPCRDGGIDATIDHGEGFMLSKEVTDIYSTEEPQSAFHARVAFCLDIHNEVSQSCVMSKCCFQTLSAILHDLHTFTLIVCWPWLPPCSCRHCQPIVGKLSDVFWQ